MSAEKDLYSIEEGFWLAGKEHFLRHLDDRCMLAFPQAGEMHGVFSREQIAATASAPGRWRDLRMTNRQSLDAAENVTILSYRVDVKRADGQQYAALIGSCYIGRPDGWKLASHQHSPI